MKLDVKVASIDALDAVKAKAGRICPLNCEHGFRADGGRCVTIVCGQGSFINDDNERETKRERPAAKPEAKRQPTQPELSLNGQQRRNAPLPPYRQGRPIAHFRRSGLWDGRAGSIDRGRIGDGVRDERRLVEIAYRL